MATLVLTLTADQMRSLALRLTEAANASPSTVGISVTLDNAPAAGVVAVSVPGDVRGNRKM